eukprot:TRINITY_DN56795_c0_g1_i1.p1 TRINITY_DN56795_c0_g1~~TRINITY_DN56795_c0_g1_i1.p1  ORF type:complete len:406 (+),score=53.30 TRINITY_DN56795_c0_g1_i1:52-1269(+)
MGRSTFAMQWGFALSVGVLCDAIMKLKETASGSPQPLSPSFLAAQRAPRISLQREHGLFMARLSFGDGHNLTALVDTGSGNLVVPSAYCSSVGCGSHRRFRPDEDPTAHLVVAGETSEVALSFGTGHLTGTSFEGRVCFEDATCGLMHFIVASLMSQEFKDYKFDGILGLGLPRQGAGKGFSVIGDLATQQALLAPEFVLSLRSSKDSVLILGSDRDCCCVASDTNSSKPSTSGLKVRGSSKDNASFVSRDCRRWHQLPVDAKHGEWAVHMDDVAIEGSRLGLCGTEGCRAVVDSGCGGIAAPRRLVQRLKDQLKIENCAYIGALPRIEFILGGRSFHVGPERYVEVSAVDPSHCRVLIDELDDDVSLRTFILGIPFMLDRDVWFDQGRMQIGLAPASTVSTTIA